ncbi:hypothetical protein P3T40_003556 [Paraburkholderia sp. EB58]|uniref:hypothetical protein n=1 Tax=Paraburkholderia sp. EB58 TaxID=3035125 RepID=UPI003D25D437
MSKEHMTRAEWNAANKGAPAVVNAGFDVGVRTTPRVKPDGARSVEPGYRNNGSSQRAGPGETKAAGTFKMSGKLAAKMLDFANTLHATASVYKKSRDAREVITTAKDAGQEVTADLDILTEKCWQAAVEAVQNVLAQFSGLVGEINEEAAAQADTVGQPDAEGVVETNSGEVPRSLDAATLAKALEKKRAVIDAAIAEAGNQNAVRRVWGLPAVNLKDDEAYKAVLNAGK